MLAPDDMLLFCSHKTIQTRRHLVMEKISRRKFTKNTALAIVAGSLAVSTTKVSADGKEGSKYPVVLYRETEEWKTYYETLTK
jgi:hypothetical protein